MRPFVVGVPRSGTTLLRMMLDEHPQLAIPAETHYMPELIRLWRQMKEDGTSEKEMRKRSLEFLAGYYRREDWPVSAKQLAAATKVRPLRVSDVLSAVHVAYAKKVDKPFWGDKTPQYLKRMGPIQKAIPTARFIHLVRDGRDVGVSLTGLSWGAETTEEAATQWVTHITRARERAEEMVPGSYLEIRYEDLVVETEATLKRVVEFIELPWDPAMLDYHRTAAERVNEWNRDLERLQGGIIPAAERTAQHKFTSQPPTTERIGRWRRDMPPEEQRRFEEIAGDLLDDFGYERAFGTPQGDDGP